MKTESRTQLVILVYDVSNDRRRTRLHKLLKQYGVPVQESAFEARLEAAERKRLMTLVGKMIDCNEDRFTMYPIARDNEERIISIGAPRPDLPAQTFFIL